MSHNHISSEEIKHISNLARLDIEDKDIEKYTRQINDIFSIIDLLQSINTDEITEKSHILPGVNFFREDTVTPSQNIEDTLKNAPEIEDDFIKMPKILDTD